MRIQPRQQLLEIWAADRAVVLAETEKVWRWGGRDGSNSISDAEQLLCLLLPATQVDAFKLDRPDETADEMIRALRPLGNATEIPRTLIGVLTRVLRPAYTDDDRHADLLRRHLSSAAPAAPASRPRSSVELDIVDSFAMSVTLSLADLGFLRVLPRRGAPRGEPARRSTRWRRMASVRLSAAMVGLLRSFTVNVFDVDSHVRPGADPHGQPGRPAAAAGRRAAAPRAAADHRELPRGPDRLRPGGRPRQPRPALRVRLVLGHRHGTRRRSRPTSRSASSPRASRRTRRTSTSRSSRSTPSRTSSPSAPGSSACSTTSSSGCPGRCSCGGS